MPRTAESALKEINVDIETLISTSAKNFHLADVVAANISLFHGPAGEAGELPWDISKFLIIIGDPELEREFAEGLVRLERIFEARHNFVHETALTDEPVEGLIEAVSDAIQLITLFEKGVEGLDMSPKYSAIRADESLNTATDRLTGDIDLAFEVIRAECKFIVYAGNSAALAATEAYFSEGDGDSHLQQVRKMKRASEAFSRGPGTIYIHFNHGWRCMGLIAGNGSVLLCAVALPAGNGPHKALAALGIGNEVHMVRMTDADSHNGPYETHEISAGFAAHSRNTPRWLPAPIH